MYDDAVTAACKTYTLHGLANLLPIVIPDKQKHMHLGKNVQFSATLIIAAETRKDLNTHDRKVSNYILPLWNSLGGGLKKDQYSDNTVLYKPRAEKTDTKLVCLHS